MAHPPVDQEVFWSVNWDDFEWVFHGRTVGEFTSTSWKHIYMYIYIYITPVPNTLITATAPQEHAVMSTL